MPGPHPIAWVRPLPRVSAAAAAARPVPLVTSPSHHLAPSLLLFPLRSHGVLGSGLPLVLHRPKEAGQGAGGDAGRAGGRGQRRLLAAPSAFLSCRSLPTDHPAAPLPQLLRQVDKEWRAYLLDWKAPMEGERRATPGMLNRRPLLSAAATPLLHSPPTPACLPARRRPQASRSRRRWSASLAAAWAP